MAGTGVWSSVFDWPIIGLHAILLPDNKLLTYGTDEMGQQGAMLVYDVWDFETNTHYTLEKTTPTDLFCSAAAYVPETGQVLIFGGDTRGQHWMPGMPMPTDPDMFNGGVADVNVYDPVTMTISPLEADHNGMGDMDHETSMAFARWYPTAVTLANGKIVSLGGIDGNKMGVAMPELYDPMGGWKTIDGAETVESRGYYPRAFLAGDGDIYMFRCYSPANNLAPVMRMDPSGDGSVEQVGKLPFATRWDNPAIQFEQNKVLILADNGDAWIMNMAGKVPTFTKTGSVGETRHWSNMVVLADGSVMLSGGSGVQNQLINVTNDVQIWNPATGQWTEGPDAAIPRLYHSTTILLPDATVMSLGGGAPGPLVNLNGEIYKPGYLFNPDGTLATRPVITAAPDELAQRQDFNITVDDAASVQRLTLVKYGSTTHSFNFGAGKLELPFTVGANNTIHVNMPDNANVLTPGNWMLFAINKNGTPSVAARIEVDVGGEAFMPKMGGFLTLNGEAGFNEVTNIVMLTHNKADETGAVLSNTRFDLKSDFDIQFDIHLGNKGGGEGAAFFLHANPFGGDATGEGGAGLGAYGIGPGLGIQFDTKYDGAGKGDIAAPHTNIFNTDGNNLPGANVTNPTALANLDNGGWHTVRVSIDGDGQRLIYWVDGEQIASYYGNLVGKFFDGSNFANFGFSGATSDTGDIQRVRVVSLHATNEDGNKVSIGGLGSSGKIVQYGSSNDDVLAGTPNADLIVGFKSNDTIQALAGQDSVDGGIGNDKCYGGTQADSLRGGDGNDLLEGGGGNDVLEGGNGKDLLYGGIGNDTFKARGQDGNDLCNGGYGFDTADFTNVWGGGVVVSLPKGSAGSGTLGQFTLVSVEGVVGSNGADTIVGTYKNETFAGSGGQDFLNGAAGNDVLAGGLGNDLLRGGAGRDTFLFDTALDRATNVDRIVDFNPAFDTIRLDHDVFAEIQGKGWLKPGEFVAGTKATDANDHVIYDRAHGALYYDADGNGAGRSVIFAVIANHAALTAADIYIV